MEPTLDGNALRWCASFLGKSRNGDDGAVFTKRDERHADTRVQRTFADGKPYVVVNT